MKYHGRCKEVVAPGKGEAGGSSTPKFSSVAMFLFAQISGKIFRDEVRVLARYNSF